MPEFKHDRLTFFYNLKDMATKWLSGTIIAKERLS